MAAERSHTLPKVRNPMLEEERAPGHEILVERRCLGQTELKVKPGQVGTSNATKLENLGVLDYAHLRVPLPKDLAGSGIFSRGTNKKWPEAYFLMRRSSDGFISATGMFKAAFPFAQHEEEALEKDYIKSLEETSSEEVAGNVWIDPTKALDLAEEYGIKLWIAALLDPEPITHGVNDPKKSIKSPPPFQMAESVNGIGRTPGKTPAKGTKRGPRSVRRSESPTKAAARKIASPRKRKARATTASIDETNRSIREEADNQVNGEHKNAVKVEVETTTSPGGEEDATKVNVTMPTDHPDMKVPSDPKEMMEQARKMVEEGRKLDGQSKAKGKRKASEMSPETDGPASPRPAKKVKPVEIELRKERIKRRAMTGIVASLAVGALLPTLMNAFSSWA